MDAAARSLLLAAVVGAGLAVLRARNVVAQKAAWTLVLAAALLMPLLAPWAAHIPGVPSRVLRIPATLWLRPSAESVGVATAAIPARANDLGTQPILNASRAVAPATERKSTTLAGNRFPALAVAHVSGDTFYTTATTEPARQSAPLSWAGIAVLLYLPIAVALLVRLAYGLCAAAALWLRAQPVRLGQASAKNARLRVRCSHGLTSPVTVGSGVVLPADYPDWDAEKLRIVLAHEASHVRQGDFYLQLCASIYAAIFWFSPLGWWLKRKLSDLSEMISDRAAVSEAASHASYAQVLLEFAALPRPIPIGVAMAHHGRILPRIERLLNESSFRQAFAGGKARIAAAVVLVPVALFAATALVRVQAAGQQAPQSPAPATAPTTQAPPTQAPATPAPPTQAPAKGPAAPNAPRDPAIPPPPAGPGTTVVPDGAPDVPPPPPPPPQLDEEGAGSGVGSGAGNAHDWSVSSSQSDTQTTVHRRKGSSFSSNGHGYVYSFNDNGDSYAVISASDKNNITFSGDWYDGRKAEIEKARSMAHGDFLWFTHDGKSYVVDDPAIANQIQAIYKPMEALGKQQAELGKQQSELGRQQGALGRQERQASVPTPEMTREMAGVEKAVAELKAARGQSITQEKLADMQAKLAELQGRLGELQGEMGGKQGEFGAQMGKLGAMQGELGAQQGKLGAEQGRLAREADAKVKAIIDESLKNGKARPVE
jgi:beta-lactamase regulating signal transducer with metallopeptidase domain